MSLPEIISLVALAVVALQMSIIMYIIRTTLQTMQNGHEIVEMATELTRDALDKLVEIRKREDAD